MKSVSAYFSLNIISVETHLLTRLYYSIFEQPIHKSYYVFC